MVLRYAIAGAITGYQKHFSPRKGYCCAYRALHGGPSCSEFGRRVVLRYGVLRFFVLQVRRFARCSNAFAALQAKEHKGKEYSNFPWKACLKNKKVDEAGTCCCMFPL
ncbi:membrane protein insertion efficiency factor YidD [Thauera sp. CAU 1555]|uniref:Membrane protein insertion efficiency factor YidD n=1 Tax=Thauera sedimentorum TaxID=2767595 RepID=A0ABR9BBL5_9RHOO|nr:membrane protein insertion efficiency factor YidD [Thauera sedimentorum]MBD8502895.1 membrane protein insertion efficiency factor YidD [Thauera sedimentorum]